MKMKKNVKDNNINNGFGIKS